MLQDANTYGLADIVTWLKDEWDVGVGMSSVHRDRVREARGQRVNDLVTAKIKAAGEMMQKAGAGSQWETGLSIAGGITLSTLMQYGEESLRELSPGDVIKLLNTMAKLSTAQETNDPGCGGIGEDGRQKTLVVTNKQHSGGRAWQRWLKTRRP
jgi:hypothetical protein